MAWTRHGHHIAGSHREVSDSVEKAKCGGPGVCHGCSADLLDWVDGFYAEMAKLEIDNEDHIIRSEN